MGGGHIRLTLDWVRTSDLCSVNADQGPNDDVQFGENPKRDKGFHLSSVLVLHGRFRLSDGHLTDTDARPSGIAQELDGSGGRLGFTTPSWLPDAGASL